MVKNRNKKKAAAAAADMAIDNSTPNLPLAETAQAMDTSENMASNSSVDVVLRRTKKGGRPMKRSKNTRKMKAVARAISKTEKFEEKSCKMDSKTVRTKLSKNLYD